MSIAHNIIMALRGKTAGAQQPCDGCEGTFQIESLHPCSGDWWLCDKCLREYMSGDGPIIQVDDGPSA